MYIVLEAASKIMAATDKGAALCNLDGKTCKTGLPTPGADSAQVQQILQIVFAVSAALAVLMIVIAGLRFITAQGNPQEISKARSTIAYAIIGLLISITAEAIVTFTIGNLGNS